MELTGLTGTKLCKCPYCERTEISEQEKSINGVYILEGRPLVAAMGGLVASTTNAK